MCKLVSILRRNDSTNADSEQSTESCKNNSQHLLISEVYSAPWQTSMAITTFTR